MIAEKDWLLENLANPTYDVQDLVTMGNVSTDNTQFLSKETYMNSQFIKDAFSDDEGNFLKDDFEKFYTQLATKWNSLQEQTYEQGLELDPFDTSLTRPGHRQAKLNISLSENFNPDRIQIGVEGFLTMSDPTKSRAEIGQSNFIYDTENQKFKTETPEDYALFNNPIKWFKDLLSEPLVLAKYEEDTIDENGEFHQKGEYKLNQFGTYYYETLNGRSPIGREILSIGDVLTKEDSLLNKIDFFDSDDLQKSIAGVVAKNVALIAPMFIAPIAPWYYGALIAKELATTMPMLTSMIFNLYGEETSTPSWINTLAGYGESATLGTSQYSKENVFTAENLINLIGEVALQWGTQKQIVKMVDYFGTSTKSKLAKAEQKAFEFYKSKKDLPQLQGLSAIDDVDWKNSILGARAMEKFTKSIMESATKKQKIGANVALAYMALISNTDVYATMKEKGATEKEAAWVALASTLGMYAVDKWMHLGEIFFDEATDDFLKQSRKQLRQEMSAINLSHKYGTKETTSNLIKKGWDFGKKAANTFVTNLKNKELGFAGKAFGEALEEVSEEAVTDLSKGIYSLLGDFGMYEASVENPIDWDSAFERYAMSFIGGAFGGGLFYGIDKYNRHDINRDRDLTELILQGHSEDLINQAKKAEKQGLNGSRTLSGTKYTLDENGNITWLSTEDPNDSQNHIATMRFIEKVNSIKATLLENDVLLNEDQQFEHLTLSDARYASLKNASHITGYYEEFDKRIQALLKAENDYKKAAKTKDGTINGEIPTDLEKRNQTDEEKAAKEKALKTLEDQVTKAKEAIKEYLSGDYSFKYVRKLNFALDPVLNYAFLGLDQEKWFQDRLDPTKITNAAELEKLYSDWYDHVKSVLETQLDVAFDAYLNTEKQIIPGIQALEGADISMSNLEKSLQEIPQLGEFLSTNKLNNIDSRLDDESDEDYDNRHNNTTEDLKIKNVQRIQKILELNNEIYKKYIQQYDDLLKKSNYEVTSAQARMITQNITQTFKEFLNIFVELPFVVNGISYHFPEYNNIYKKLNYDLSNLEDLRKEVFTKLYNNIENNAKNILQDLNEIPPVNIFYNRNTFNISKLNKLIKKLEKVNSDKYTELIQTLKNLKDLTKTDQTALQKAFELIPKEVEIEETLSLENILTRLTQSEPENRKNTIIKEDISDLAQMYLGFNVSIQEFIDDLKDTNSYIYKYLEQYNPNIPQLILEVFSNNEKTLNRIGLNTPFAVFTSNDFDNIKSDDIDRRKEAIITYEQALIKAIQNNPIIDFKNKLKTTLTSPLENLFKSISKNIGSNDNELFNVNYILQQVYQDFINSESHQKFELNDTQNTQLILANKIIDIVNAYIYAASTKPGSHSFWGQNKNINNFIEAHKKDISWEKLPEINLELAAYLRMEAENLQKEINIWRQISENSAINKSHRLAKADKLLTELKINLLKELSVTFTVDAQQYNLTEGINFIADEKDMNTLYQMENLIFSNWQKIKEETKLSDSELFTKLFEVIIPNKQSVTTQIVSKINDSIQELTDYDKCIYLLTLVSDNPKEYYQSLVDFTKTYKDIAPLPAQLAGVRIAEAAHNQTYKQGFKILANYLNLDLTVLENYVHLNGVAGAGKTAVQLKHIRERFKDEKALLIGPTSDQAVGLQNSLKEGTSYVFDQKDKANIFSQLVYDWNSIKQEFEKASKELFNEYVKKQIDGTVSTEYFDISYINNGIVVNLKEDKIKFNKEFDQTLIFIDEASHLSTFHHAIINLYADKVKGTVFAASDSNQSGYTANKNNRIENIDPDTVFITRIPKLQESLRSQNIQKQSNNNKVSTLLDIVEEAMLTGDQTIFQQVLNKLPELVKSLNLRAYNKDDINGDLFNIKEQQLQLIPKEIVDNDKVRKTSVGFVGEEGSPMITALRNLGFDIVPLQETNMQGKEYDYVVVDHLDNFTIDATYNGYLQLKRLYTIMTRAKIGTLFVDNFTDITGKNTIDEYKSKGFTIANQVEIFRQQFLQQLETLDLDQPIVDGKKKEQSTNEVEFYSEPKETVVKTEKNVIESKIESRKNWKSVQAIANNFVLEFQDTQILTGLKSTIKRGKKYATWEVPTKNATIKRNLHAFIQDNGKITSLSEKEALQQKLSRIQSAILFGEDRVEIEGFINFNNSWRKRKLSLEIRKYNETIDNPGVDQNPVNPIIYNGEKYIISIVCKVPNLKTSVEANSFEGIFDICLSRDFEFLENNIDSIKRNLQEDIDTLKKNGKDSSSLENINVEQEIKNYRDFIIEQIKQLKENDSISIDLTDESINLNKVTRLVPREKSRRLGGTIGADIVENHEVDEKGNYIENYNTFIHKDKRKVVSPVYLLGKKSDVLKKVIPESILGKAVVFTSSNTNLDPVELAKMYVNQKTDESNNTPQVRMVLLDNHGLSFSELVHNKLINEVGGGKPWRMDVLGVRMFAAMWNFRAAIINYKKALEQWKKDNNLSSQDVETLCKIERKLFEYNQAVLNKQKPSITQKEVDELKNIYKDGLEKLNNFNQEICKNIPIFRLGDGEYIRSFDIDGNYTNLLITDKIDQYFDILESILNQITGNEIPKEYQQVGFNFKSMNTKITKADGSDYLPNEYIGNDDRTLSGLIKTQDKQVSLKGDNAIYPESFFSFVPKALTAIVKTVKRHQNNPLDSSQGFISIQTIKSNDETEDFDFDLSTIYDTVGNEDNNIIYDMFNLIFHGSKENLEQPHPYLDEAFAKFGFFIDPDLYYVDNKEDIDKINLFGKDGKEYTLLRIGTALNYFDVDVDVRPPGMGLILSNIINKSKKNNQQSIVETEKVKKGYSETIENEIIRNYIQENINEGNIEEDNENDVEKYLNKTYKTAITQYLTEKQSLSKTIHQQVAIAKFGNLTNLFNNFSNPKFSQVDKENDIYVGINDSGKFKIRDFDENIEQFNLIKIDDSKQIENADKVDFNESKKYKMSDEEKRMWRETKDYFEKYRNIKLDSLNTLASKESEYEEDAYYKNLEESLDNLVSVVISDLSGEIPYEIVEFINKMNAKC